jgi:hypothetical protein
MKYVFAALAVYLVLGLVAAFFLKQTPYAENPLWTMILLWPLYLIG